MLLRRTCVFFLLLFVTTLGWSQNKAIDVQHYQFSISLNDTTNVVEGQATITFIPTKTASQVYFDLDEKNASTGKGMKVMQVTTHHKKLSYNQKDDKVYIQFDKVLVSGKPQTITLTYRGIPSDGLIISKSKFGHRTFFADNWPNRAHNWIPCNDHPSDKATVDFLVTAPAHYLVVGNGIKVTEVSLPRHRRLTHWQMNTVIPTKVMAIGVADFAVQHVATVANIPIQTWVFAANKKAGFKQYAIAKDILPFYIKYIGPYAYKKLANVQSKTRFGGMEDASNIFYNQNSVVVNPKDSAKQEKKLAALMAHEIAHQWFGDEASEIDWPHLWLSEGFATYFTDLYFEHHYGERAFKERLNRERQTVLKFYRVKKTPVVDKTESDNLMALLNANSYQKGGWALHMLRRKLGDTVFQNGIRTYYKKYKGKNASTSDFRTVMEQVSGQNLKPFFKQWLYTPGQPELIGVWHYDASKKEVTVTINQTQPILFHFPLQIGIKFENHQLIRSFTIKKRKEILHIPVNYVPKQVVLDPDVNLLFSGRITEKK